MRSRVPRSLLFGTIAITSLLVLLATLQYRWVGQIAEADQARLLGGARSHAQFFARDFDREVTRAFLWLQADAAAVRTRDFSRFAERYARWRGSTVHPGLVKEIWLADAGGQDPRRFDPATSTFEPAPWPASLAVIRERIHERIHETVSPAPPPASPGPGASPFRYGRRWGTDLFDGELPAFFVPIPSAEPSPPYRAAMGPLHPSGFTIVSLDLDYIQQRLFPALAQRHVGEDDDADYRLVVSRRGDPTAVLFRSAPGGAEALASGDASAGLLGLRLEDAAEEDRAAMLFPGSTPSGTGPPEPRHFGRPRRLGSGPGEGENGRWRLVVTHRAGSVDKVVAAARQRNLAVSAGILALLGLSVVPIVVSTQRARRLADRQLEFVAGVSHELRTPVAVICSAGENLADGVIGDPAMVARYGRIVRDEGRRLADMVEQVLDFAGSYSGRRAYRFEDVRVEEVVNESLAAAGSALQESGVVIEAVIEPGLPHVRGDHVALRRAVQNLLQNAVKYGGENGAVRVRVSAGTTHGQPEVCISVEDRGFGIPPHERERIFEPFFRGEEVQARQIRGSGLGLSLVQRIVEAHGGRVALESEPGRGSTFTIALPYSSAAASPAPLRSESPAHGTPHTAG